MNRKQKLKTLLIQGIKFVIVGLMNTAITLGTIFLLNHVLDFHYILSNAIGYSLGLVNSFLWNKNWTFKSRGNALQQTLYFLIAFAICYTLQLFILLILVETFLIKSDYAQIIGMVVYTGTNFVINKLITFRKKEIL